MAIIKISGADIRSWREELNKAAFSGGGRSQPRAFFRLSIWKSKQDARARAGTIDHWVRIWELERDSWNLNIFLMFKQFICGAEILEKHKPARFSAPDV